MSATISCPECGASENDNARFCGECGTALAEAVPTSTPAAAETAAPPATDVPGAEGVPPVSRASEPSSWPEPNKDTAIHTRPAVPPVAAQPHAPTALSNAPEKRRLTKRRGVGAAAAVVLLAAAAAAVVFTTNSHHTKTARTANHALTKSVFWHRVNADVLDPLANTDASAQAHLNSRSGNAAADGIAIEQTADSGIAALRRLPQLAPAQASARAVLMAFVRSNRDYGLALQKYASNDDFSALATAAASAGSAATTASAAVSEDADLPPGSRFKLVPPAATSSAPSTTPRPNDGREFVVRVDNLLNRSHATLLQLQQAVAQYSSNGNGPSLDPIVEQRRTTLAQARDLTAPSALAHAQLLLIRSLQLSLTDDAMLRDWASAKASGDVAGAKRLFDQANAVGTKALSAKRQFLAVYAPLAEAELGTPDARIPDSY